MLALKEKRRDPEKLPWDFFSDPLFALSLGAAHPVGGTSTAECSRRIALRANHRTAMSGGWKDTLRIREGFPSNRSRLKETVHRSF